jgi:hypothetical protein
MGIQVIAPGEHSHTPNQEILFCFAGTIIVDGVPHPFVPGTTVYAAPGVRHKIINDGPDELKMTWTYLPPGLDDFFAAIGRASPARRHPNPLRDLPMCMTMISSSSAVWECHGTTHPGGAFRIHVDGPVTGSPVSSADGRHATSRSGANGTDPKGFTVPVIASSARTPPPVRHPSAAAARNILFIVVLLLAARCAKTSR